MRTDTTDSQPLNTSLEQQPPAPWKHIPLPSSHKHLNLQCGSTCRNPQPSGAASYAFPLAPLRPTAHHNIHTPLLEPRRRPPLLHHQTPPTIETKTNRPHRPPSGLPAGAPSGAPSRPPPISPPPLHRRPPGRQHALAHPAPRLSRAQHTTGCVVGAEMSVDVCGGGDG